MVNSSSESTSWSERRRNLCVRSCLRTIQDVLRLPLLNDLAVVHEDQPVADLPGELHLVRDDEHRHPEIAGKVAHDDEHLAHELGVERRRDLVEEHHVRIHHQRPRDRDPLLLTARELVRVLPGLLLQADSREQLVGPRLGLLPTDVLHATRGERHVVDRTKVREEIELLKDNADRAGARRRRRHASP